MTSICSVGKESRQDQSQLPQQCRLSMSSDFSFSSWDSTVEVEAEELYTGWRSNSTRDSGMSNSVFSSVSLSTRRPSRRNNAVDGWRPRSNPRGSKDSELELMCNQNPTYRILRKRLRMHLRAHPSANWWMGPKREDIMITNIREREEARDFPSFTLL